MDDAANSKYLNEHYEWQMYDGYSRLHKHTQRAYEMCGSAPLLCEQGSLRVGGYEICYPAPHSLEDDDEHNNSDQPDNNSS